MRALRFDGEQLYYERNYPDPVRGDGAALVRVVRAGICDTDRQITRGYMGFQGVLGHEFVGVVEQAGDKKWLGRRVVGEINCSCGKCELCLAGLGTHCPNRTVLGILNHDGVFADYVVLPERNLHVVPDDISDDEAVFIEPLAAAFQIPRQVRLERKTRVAVLGDGKLGNLVAQVMRERVDQLLVIGKYRAKLDLLDRLQIQTTRVGDFVPRKDFDVVVDCTGSTGGFELALQLVRPRGTLVLKTTVATETPLNLTALVIDEITVVGSRCGPFPEAISALAQRRVEVLPLISEVYRLKDGVEAVQVAEQSDKLKVLLAVDESVPSVKKVRS